jgi:NodT family efflux transporter outer membrane factor (OMF) lipoprotein
MTNVGISFKYLSMCVLALVLAACTVGPDYVRPTPLETIPTAFKELEGWKVATPADTQLTTKWWELFNNPQLSSLEEQVVISNQNIALAAARFRQARSLVDGSRSAYYPSLTIGASDQRSAVSATIGQGQSSINSIYLLPATLTWELDVWGRIGRAVEASQAGLQASAADLAAAQLSAQAELASNYFQLRSLDAQRQYLDESCANYRKNVELTNNRYQAGIAARVDLLQAETQLKSTEAQAVDLGVQRAQLEHAIALLIGKPASVFALSALPLKAEPPVIPLSLPSELLERRPDIASAERLMASANALVGVAKAAYYPTVKLSSSIGLEASDIARWLTWPSRFWSIGPSLSENVFDGGLRRAQNQQALAVYEAAVASYRQSVLSAFRDVEDNLAALKILDNEAVIQNAAVEASEKSSQITLYQYQAGVVGYLNVITVQTAELANRKTAIGILGRRMTASVQLIKALGGGWTPAAPL